MFWVRAEGWGARPVSARIRKYLLVSALMGDADLIEEAPDDDGVFAATIVLPLVPPSPFPADGVEGVVGENAVVLSSTLVFNFESQVRPSDLTATCDHPSCAMPSRGVLIPGLTRCLRTAGVPGDASVGPTPPTPATRDKTCDEGENSAVHPAWWLLLFSNLPKYVSFTDRG